MHVPVEVSDPETKLSDLIHIEDAQDCVFIAGAKVAGDLFRMLAKPTAAGYWFRIVSVSDVITVETKRDPRP